jgi:hypothetical protein
MKPVTIGSGVLPGFYLYATRRCWREKCGCSSRIKSAACFVIDGRMIEAGQIRVLGSPSIATTRLSAADLQYGGPRYPLLAGASSRPSADDTLMDQRVHIGNPDLTQLRGHVVDSRWSHVTPRHPGEPFVILRNLW